MRALFVVMLASSVLFPLGCNQSFQQSGNVAVVDLDQVAATLGRTELIKSAIEQRKDELNRKVSGAKTSYENQLRATAAKLGEEPSDEQKQQLVKMQQQANKQLTQYAQQAKGNLQQHRAQLLQQFRDEARTVAQQVAKEKGLSMVVTKNDSFVLAYDDAADITREVAQRMRPTGSTTNRVATPPLGQSGW